MKSGESINDIIKTNIYFPRKMFDSLKLMAVLTRSSMSQIVREAVADKLEKLKQEIQKPI